MAFAITQTCCTDASCVAVCPVNCIHPTPDERGFGSASMLFIDPDACIDCGACADACPVDAIGPVDMLADEGYAEINAAYFREHPADHAWGAPDFPRTAPGVGPLRVAVVGTGPAACYAAQELLRSTEAEVTMIDRLATPGGLVRYGVAPDHPSTKKVGDTFATLFSHPRVRLHLGVEVGRDLTHAELAEHHHAVIYGTGPAADRRLDVPGEDLPGSVPATRVVGWYNGHPDVPPDALDPAVELAGQRAVVIGNGNVALDVARVLLTDPDALAGTAIAGHALERLRRSAVREVVVLGRRGLEHAAYTRPELRALTRLDGVELVVDDDPDTAAAIEGAAPGSHAGLLAGVARRPVDLAAAPGPGRRIVLRFGSSPTAILGEDRVTAVRTAAADIAAGLAVRAVGYRGTPLPGLPFDPASATVPHTAGRVVDPDTGSGVPGTYVVGWAKRGPSGGIGTNRTCASETVGTLLDDALAGELPAPTRTARHLTRLLRRRRRRGRSTPVTVAPARVGDDSVGRSAAHGRGSRPARASTRSNSVSVATSTIGP
ncbi:ferredoxin--NADP(+) reductase [Actinomycetospora sp. NBRC 106375]|uniref:FAD-dependent oxidoreductase n=1 Tax=Actinomycetospora sp. NBRC 106375 TaxID=3032207 RepID=UPI0024A561CD|nr:FAD-dependent oxidoreductase [Actinomycetospora sp. NBRC 106375]GLZ49935.1 ferredoxin--NADP(+) reductase [Actinomycetospora sp. NBRC 106375]